MVTKAIAAMLIIIYILFILSVIAPMHSRKKFWVAIYKIRAVMDFVSYWFFNLCAIAAVLCILWLAISRLLFE